MGSSKVLLLQMYLNFVTHWELVWHQMLIMSLLVLSIGFFQYVMDLLEDVLDVLNGFFNPVYFKLYMR